MEIMILYYYLVLRNKESVMQAVLLAIALSL
jgi:hypothetical protein